LSFGYFGLVLPAVRIILTERDEILTEGIKASCRRAGKGGRVVAVLGLLHVNGVAQRMLTAAATESQETKEEES
jgi:pheromone shutdown protein TraB